MARLPSVRSVTRVLGRRSLFVVAPSLALMLGVARTSPAQSADGAAGAAARTPVVASTDPRARPNVVTVVTREFAFDMPDSLPAGLTTFRLRNAGRQPHHLMLYRLDAGRQLPDVHAALSAGGAHPPWMQAVGGPNAVVGDRESVGTLLLLPGRYVAFCHVKSPDNVLHFEKGMMKLITVVAAPHTAMQRAITPIAADLHVTLSDYAFRFSHVPTRGRHRIAVTNRGRQPHEFILSKLLPGRTNADFVHWMDTQNGLAPVRPYGGATDLPPGGTIVLDIDLEPGRYSVVCRVRDVADGLPHDRHGMMAQFTVP